MNNLKPQIIRDSALTLADKMAQQNEGLTYKPYHDTVGKLTIGYGRNLEDRGITFEEAKLLLANDIIEAHNELWTQFGFFSGFELCQESGADGYVSQHGHYAADGL